MEVESKQRDIPAVERFFTLMAQEAGPPHLPDCTLSEEQRVKLHIDSRGTCISHLAHVFCFSAILFLCDYLLRLCFIMPVRRAHKMVTNTTQSLFVLVYIVTQHTHAS